MSKYGPLGQDVKVFVPSYSALCRLPLEEKHLRNAALKSSMPEYADWIIRFAKEKGFGSFYGAPREDAESAFMIISRLNFKLYEQLTDMHNSAFSEKRPFKLL